MNLHPRDVDRMSPAEFALSLDVWKAVNLPAEAGGAVDAPTDEEARARADGDTFFQFALRFYGASQNRQRPDPGTVNMWEEYNKWKRDNPEAQEAALRGGLIGSPDARFVSDAPIDVRRDLPADCAVVGYDFCEPMLELGRIRARKEGVSLEFKTGDCMRLPIAVAHGE